jgi:Helix-turn-helix domain
LKALVGSLKWSDAAEIIGISDRSLRRWRQRYEQCGYDGLYDRRKRRPSPKRIPIYYAQFGEGRRHAHADASGAGGDRKPRGFCALYSDRASHFFVTPKAGGKVDPNQLTQLGRALQGLGIKMIRAYSPQARGRMYADLASS